MYVQNGGPSFRLILATHLQVRQVVITGHLHPLGKTPKLEASMAMPSLKSLSSPVLSPRKVMPASQL